MGALSSAVCAVFPQFHLVQVQGSKTLLFQLLCCITNYPKDERPKKNHFIIFIDFVSQEFGQGHVGILSLRGLSWEAQRLEDLGSSHLSGVLAHMSGG